MALLRIIILANIRKLGGALALALAAIMVFRITPPGALADIIAATLADSMLVDTIGDMTSEAPATLAVKTPSCDDCALLRDIPANVAVRSVVLTDGLGSCPSAKRPSASKPRRDI